MHFREFLRLALVIVALLLADHVIAADFRVLDVKSPCDEVVALETATGMSVPSGMQGWRVSMSYTAKE